MTINIGIESESQLQPAGVPFVIFEFLQNLEGVVEADPQTAAAHKSHFFEDDGVHVVGEAVELFIAEHIEGFLFIFVDVVGEGVENIFEGVPDNLVGLGVVEGEEGAGVVFEG